METRFEIAPPDRPGPFRALQIAGRHRSPNRRRRRLILQTALLPGAGADSVARHRRRAWRQGQTPADRNMLFLSSPEFMHR